MYSLLNEKNRCLDLFYYNKIALWDMQFIEYSHDVELNAEVRHCADAGNTRLTETDCLQSKQTSTVYVEFTALFILTE